MSKIVLNDRAYLDYDGLQYIPNYYDPGGKEYRIIATGEMTVTEPKWRNTGTFHATIDAAIKELAKQFVLERSEY